MKTFKDYLNLLEAGPVSPTQAGQQPDPAAKTGAVTPTGTMGSTTAPAAGSATTDPQQKGASTLGTKTPPTATNPQAANPSATKTTTTPTAAPAASPALASQQQQQVKDLQTQATKMGTNFKTQLDQLTQALTKMNQLGPR